MKRFGLVAIVASLAFVAMTPPVLAQDTPGTLGQIIQVDPMPGHASALEEGSRDHLEWYTGAGGGTWEWRAFEIVMGERTGQYMWGTFGHNYADFDTPDVDQQASNESIDRNIAPHVQDVMVSLVNLRPELSILVEDAPPMPMYEVITFELNSGMDDEFEHFLEMVKEGIQTVGAPYNVYQYAQGSPGNTWVVSIPHANFASMGEMGNDGFQALMEQVHGELGAAAAQDMFDRAVATMSSDVFAFRPDLSVNLSPT